MRASRSKKGGSRRNDLTAVSDILKALKESGPLRGYLEHAAILDHWRDIAGPKLCAHGAPKLIREQKLIIEVDSAVWMHRYAFRKAEIIRRVNRLAGKELISDIFLVLLEEGEELREHM